MITTQKQSSRPGSLRPGCIDETDRAGRASLPRAGGVGARLLALLLLTALVGCGSPAGEVQLAPTVPAATRLAQVFGAAPTPTAAARDASASPEPLPATPTAVPQPTIISGPDPRVRPDCAPLSPAATAQADAGGVTVDVEIDLQPTGRAISPLIYGVAAAKAEYVQELGATLNRWGGNQVTRHNWEINASNAGADWHFANVSYGWPDEAPGAWADDFIRSTQAVSATAIMTIPTIGYVASDGDNSTRSQDVPERGGTALQSGSERIAGYDPQRNQAATSIRSFAVKGRPFADPPDLGDDAVYQDEWVNHLVQTFGRADQGGLRWYALDNEPDLWSSTHRDIHPVDMGYDAMLAMVTQYADAIKAVDPTAKIIGPELWGVNSLFYSALDRGDNNFRTHADRRAHGNLPFAPWLLTQLYQHDQQAGHRSLDLFSVHNYPQSGVYPGGDDPQANALRLRSTQQLWNPNYTDESWLGNTEGARLQLIPRLRSLVDTYYPGTLIGITEWNYGADDTISGGLTIVDVLGIYGREGLDLASYWAYPGPTTPGASAFKLYGNYDGCGRHFGDQLVAAQSSDEQTLSAYASRDSYTGDILLMTVNKLPNTSVQASIGMAGVGTRPVEVYQFDAGHTAIQRLADVQTAADGLSYAVPAYAATLFVVKAR